MGNWAIVITGTGCHHNKVYGSDANRIAAHFVHELRRAGHTLTHASFTYGAVDDIREPVNYLDDRDAIEGDEHRIERCGTPVDEKRICARAYGHEGDHAPPTDWQKVG